MSSQVLRGPTPMKEKISRPSLTLATALPETAAGMGGIFFSSSEPSTVVAQSARAIKTGSFFIAKILPHIARLRVGEAGSFSEPAFQNQLSEPVFTERSLQNQVFRTRFCGGTRDRRRQTQLRGPGLRGERAASAREQWREQSARGLAGAAPARIRRPR